MLSVRLLTVGRVARAIAGKRVAMKYPTSFAASRAYGSSPLRLFSNEDLQKTLNKMKEDYKKDSEGEAAGAAKDADGAAKDADGAAKDADGAEKAESSEQQAAQDGKSANEGGFKMPSFDFNKIVEFGRDSIEYVTENVRAAYSEMIGENKESYLNRRVHQAETFRRKAVKEEEEEDLTDAEREAKEAKEREEAGPSAIVLVKDPKSAWESMKERLQDSPFIREVLKNSRKVSQQAAATDIGKKAADIGKSVQDKVEDVRTFWETSQNPLVYTMSGVWESMTGETEEGLAIAEIRKLDPKFNKEEWAEEVRTHLAPDIIRAHLLGNTSALKPWLGEAVYNKLAADIRTRKHDGIKFDVNVLDIDENQMILKYMESGSPVIVVVYMVQQINCIRNRKDEIIEGGESDVRAKFYSMAFQQHYDEDDGSVTWKIVDYEFGGDMPYY